MFKTEYAKRVYAELEKKNAGEKEFLQAAKEIVESIEGYIAKNPKMEQPPLHLVTPIGTLKEEGCLWTANCVASCDIIAERVQQERFWC